VPRYKKYIKGVLKKKNFAGIACGSQLEERSQFPESQKFERITLPGAKD
jgi:hypothetical protein